MYLLSATVPQRPTSIRRFVGLRRVLPTSKGVICLPAPMPPLPAWCATTIEADLRRAENQKIAHKSPNCTCRDWWLTSLGDKLCMKCYSSVPLRVPDHRVHFESRPSIALPGKLTRPMTNREYFEALCDKYGCCELMVEQIRIRGQIVQQCGRRGEDAVRREMESYISQYALAVKNKVPSALHRQSLLRGFHAAS